MGTTYLNCRWACKSQEEQKFSLFLYLWLVGQLGHLGPCKQQPLTSWCTINFSDLGLWKFYILPSSTSFCYTQATILLQQNFRLFELSEVKPLMVHKFCFIYKYAEFYAHQSKNILVWEKLNTWFESNLKPIAKWQNSKVAFSLAFFKPLKECKYWPN